MNAKDVPIRKLIHRDVITIAPDCGIDDAARLMKDENIGSLIVKDVDEMVGIITERDIVTKVVAEYRPVKAMKVKDVMSSPLITVPPDTSVCEAAKKMAMLEIRRLPVMDDGKLLGIVSETDVIRFSPDLIEVTRSV